MVWTKEMIQYMRSYKNQRNLLVDSFSFFKRGVNGQVQLKGTKYYFRVQGWNFVKYQIKAGNRMFSQFGVKQTEYRYEDCPVSFESVLDNCPKEVQEQLLFHLDLFS
ncbi:MAG: hypothetical protein ACXABY_22080 [Candidatus Thorarchaeota archaeon]